MTRVAIFTANRAEHGLLEPVHTALKEVGLEPYWIFLPTGEPIAGLPISKAHLDSFDIGLVPCDRAEMAWTALELFSHTKPFAQFHAGDVGSDSPDEVYRWIITRCASLYLCNSPEAARAVYDSGEESWRIHVVGSTAFDYTELDESVLPDEKFNLLLVHPDPRSPNNTLRDIQNAVRQSGWPMTIAIGPNRDTHWEIIDHYLQASTHRDLIHGPIDYHPQGFLRPQFLALMKHCSRFITNSSSALYELPYFDISKWVNIGTRNADRTPLQKIEAGGSQRIARILKDLTIDDQLTRKHFAH